MVIEIPWDESTSLFKHVQAKDETAFSGLVDDLANSFGVSRGKVIIAARDSSEATLLIYAIQEKAYDIALICLDETKEMKKMGRKNISAYCDWIDDVESGITALAKAVLSEEMWLIERMWESSASDMVECSDGYLAWHYAIMTHNREVAEYVFNNMSVYNSASCRYGNVLHLAVEYKLVDWFDWLTSMDIDPDDLDEDNRTPRQLAEKMGDPEVLAKLTECGL